MGCIDKTITGGFSLACDRTPKKGIVQNVKLINKSDIDYDATVFASGNDLVIESLVLNTGKTAFTFEGVKSVMNFTFNKVTKETTFNKFIHSVSVYCNDLGIASKTELQAILGGAELVAIVETKEQGVNGDSAYHVAGYENGLVATDDSTFDANEDGGMLLTLASVEDLEESKIPYTFYDTSYTATKVLVDAL